MITDISNPDSTPNYDEHYWTDSRIDSICLEDLSLQVSREDISDSTYQRIFSRLYQLAGGYEKEVIDPTSFFKDKRVAVIGMPVEDKKIYRRELSALGAQKVYYGWTDNIEILICGNDNFSPLESAAIAKRNGSNIIVMSEGYIYPVLADFMKTDKGKRLMDEYQSAEESKNRDIAQTRIADAKLINRIPQVSPQELSLNSDVFHVVGRMSSEGDNLNSNEEEVLSSRGDCPETVEQVYEEILKRGGKVNKKGGASTTCIVFGKNPPISAFSEAQKEVKHISISHFYSWLAPQPIIERDDIYKSSPLVDSVSELNQIVGTDDYVPTLYSDVFHIVGTLYPFGYSAGTSYLSRAAVYAEIEGRGGKVDQRNTGSATCVVYGCRPPRDAFRSQANRNVKYISYKRFRNWLMKTSPTDKGASVFEERYRSSVDSRLRPYQQALKEEVFKLWRFYFSLMLQLPTGTGKTVLFSSLIKDLAKVPGTKILIIAHRKELIDQISSWLDQYDVVHGIIQSGRVRHLERNIQVASIQTYTSKGNEVLMDSFIPDFIIIDEAHHAIAKTYQRLWAKYPRAWKLGVTATPYRLNHTMFTTLFSSLITSPSTGKFITDGYLSEYVYMADNPNGDISKAIAGIKEKSSTGDYVVKALLDNLNVDKYIKYAVSCYLQYAKGKKGIVYAISVEHGQNLCQAYKSIGIATEYIDSTTPRKEREDIVERFCRGETQIMVNCNIFSEGFDCPDIEFIQMTRPTYSLSMFLQQVGRGLRPNKNGEKCVILDNAGMFKKFGLPSDDRVWDRHFNGEYTSDDADEEYSINSAILYRICGAGESPMVEITDQERRKQQEAMTAQSHSGMPIGIAGEGSFIHGIQGKEDDTQSNKMTRGKLLFWSIIAAVITIAIIFFLPGLLALEAFLGVIGVLKIRRR